MSSLQALKAEIERLKGIVENNYPEKRTDLVKARFNNIYLGERPDQRGIIVPLKMPRSPDLVVGKVYDVPAEEVESNPWWVRVTP